MVATASLSLARVLVVDDSSDQTTTLVRLLEMLGAKAASAASAQEAISAVRAFQPDVVLLDLGMPDMSGFGAAEQMRTISGLPPFKIIALTGFADTKTRERCDETGFDGFLAKPLDVGLLESLIRGQGQD